MSIDIVLPLGILIIIGSLYIFTLLYYEKYATNWWEK